MSVSDLGGSKPDRGSRPEPTRESRASSRGGESESTRGASRPSNASGPPGGQVEPVREESTLDRARDLTEGPVSTEVSDLETEAQLAPSDPAASVEVVGEQADIAEALMEEAPLFVDEATPTELGEIAEQELLENLGLDLPEGVEVQGEVIPLPNGENQTVVSYELDGTSYSRTLFSDAGVDYDVLRAEIGDRVETRSTETRFLERPIEAQLPDVEFGFSLPGERGALEQTSTTFTVEEAGELEQVLETVQYQQHIPFSEDPLGQLNPNSLDVLEVHSGRLQAETLLERNPTLDLDDEVSGQYLSFTEVTRPGESGELEVLREQTSAYRIEGVDGTRPISYDHALTWQSVNGEPSGGQLVVEEEGLTTLESVAESGGIYSVDGFLERLGEPGDSLRVRSTTSLPAENGGPVERLTEWGDYDAPGDGVSFVSREGPGQGLNLTLNEVSNGGSVFDSQTVYFGTDVSSRTHAEYSGDGTFNSETLVTDAGEVLSRQTLAREILSAEQVRAELPVELAAPFLNSHVDGSIFRDIITYENPEDGIDYEANSYVSESGLLDIATTADSEGNPVSVLRDTSGVSFVNTDEGQFFSADDGSTLTPIDVSTSEVFREIHETPIEPAAQVRSQASALNRFNKIVEIVQRETPNPLNLSRLAIPSSVSPALDRAGVGFSALGVAEALHEGQPIEALRSVAGGATSFASVFGGARPEGALPSFSTPRAAAILRAGGVLNAGLAAYDLSQGEYVSAGLGAATAVGLGLAGGSEIVATGVGLAAFPEPVTTGIGLGIISVATLGSLGYALYDDEAAFEQHVPFGF